MLEFSKIGGIGRMEKRADTMTVVVNDEKNERDDEK